MLRIFRGPRNEHRQDSTHASRGGGRRASGSRGGRHGARGARRPRRALPGARGADPRQRRHRAVRERVRRRRGRTHARGARHSRRGRLDGDPAAGHGRRLTTPVQKLYEVWAGDSELRDALGQSLEPRGTDWLFELFAKLGPSAGDLVLDAGARDAVHAIRLVHEHGIRAVALDPLPLHCALARERIADAGLTEDIDVVQGALGELPFEDASFDWIWCRDVLVHVDVDRGLAECARVLRRGGVLLAYVTLATDRLEPEEADELIRALALQRASLDGAQMEEAAGAAGFVL